jgi:glutamyl/glutaminyl-tRNA synthetase
VVRRGVTMSALRKFIYAQGATRNITLQEWDKFWAINKDEFEPTAPRYMGVAQDGATPLHITGGDAVELSGSDVAAGAITVKLVPPMKDESPLRPMRVAKTVLLEAEDAETCSVGDKMILVNWGVVEVTAVEKDAASGKVLSLSGERQPEVSVKKIPRKFTWVADTSDVLVGSIKEYDHLVTKPKLEEGEDFKDFIRNPSAGTMPVLLEPCLRSLKHGDIIQLMRRGFFRVDQALDEAKGQGLELILIPDGKAKAMSTLKTALPHA